MAITATHMADGVHASPGSPFSLADSVTYVNDRLYIVTFLTRGGTTPSTTALSGGGITWATTTTSTTASPPMSQWWGLTTSGASSAQLSVTTSGGPTTVKYSIDEFAGVDTGAPIVQTAAFTGGTNSDGSVTLAAFADAVNNAVIGAFGETEADTVTPEGGYTELNDDNTGATASTLFVEWKVGEDTTVTCDFADATNAWRGTASEIKMATAVSTGKLGTVTTSRRW